MIIAIILFGGITAYNSMPRESFPEVKETKIYISSVYPGNTAEDVEKLITDPLEESLPDVGLLSLVDFETGESVVFDTTGPEAVAHSLYMRRSRELRQTMFRRLKIDFVNVRTDQPYLPALVDFFKARERRLRRDPGR